MQIPLTAEELIDQLAAEYPEVVFEPAASRDEFLMASGARRLVLNLLRRRDQDIEDSRHSSV